MDRQSSPKSPKKIEKYSAPALEKGFQVIELLAQDPAGLTISEMLPLLGIQSMSEIFRIIMVMERLGWLSKIDGTDRYKVTHKALEIVFRATPSRELTLVASSLMEEMSKKIEQSCHLVVLNADRGLVILRQEGPGPTVFAVRRGADIDPLYSCSGHVLMAHSPPSIVTKIINNRSEVSELERQKLLLTYQKVKARGYEMIPSIRTRGVTDISYPIFGADGYSIAALTVPFLELIDGTQIYGKNDVRKTLKEFATQLTIGIGGYEKKSVQ